MVAENINEHNKGIKAVYWYFAIIKHIHRIHAILQPQLNFQFLKTMETLCIYLYNLSLKHINTYPLNKHFPVKIVFLLFEQGLHMTQLHCKQTFDT